MGRVPGLAKTKKSPKLGEGLPPLLQLQIAVLLWGFTGVLGRAIEVSAYSLVIYRVLMTAGIYLLYLKWSGIGIKIARHGMMRLGIIGALMAVHWVCFYGAIKLASISVAMVCLATASIFTVFIEALVKRRPIQILELLLGFMSLLGVVFVYFDNLDFRQGLLVGILAALLSGVFTVMNKDIVHTYHAGVIAYYELLIGGVVLLMILPVLSLSGYATLEIPDASSWFYLFLLSFFCTFLGQLLALFSLRHLSAFTLSLSVNMETFYGILLAFIFYHEQELLGVKFWVGSGLIIASVLIQSWGTMRQRRKS